MNIVNFVNEMNVPQGEMGPPELEPPDRSGYNDPSSMTDHSRDK